MARGPMAGVSGPGKFSKRTDGISFQSTEYGSGVENAANKAGAPLASTPDVRPTSRSEMGMAPSQMEPVTPLYAPSQRPDEPITSGIPMGAGPGPEVLGINQPSVDTDEDKQRLLSYLPALETIAQSPSSSQSFRNYVRLLRSNLL
jgi:hypothetical protein